MSATLQVLALDLTSFATVAGAPFPILPPGIHVTAIGVEFLDNQAAGQIFLRIGSPNAPAIPLATQGRCWEFPIAQTEGLWLDNLQGKNFNAPCMLYLLIGVGYGIVPVS